MMRETATLQDPTRVFREKIVDKTGSEDPQRNKTSQFIWDFVLFCPVDPDFRQDFVYLDIKIVLRIDKASFFCYNYFRTLKN